MLHNSKIDPEKVSDLENGFSGTTSSDSSSSTSSSSTDHQQQQQQQHHTRLASTWTNFRDSFKPPLHNEKGETREQAPPALKQTMKKRQLQMIALGGCVGSGLLVASGLALQTGGPASLLIAWTIVSSFLYCTMQSLAELSSSYPVSGSFATYSCQFIDPSWGFAMGWNYSLFWVVVLPLELVAAAMTLKYWNTGSFPTVAFVAIFYALILLLNLFGGARAFGETEFWASLIKLLGVVGFNILAVVLICGGGNQGFIGASRFRDLPFASGAKGVISVLLTATYSLAGTELVGLTSAEAAGDARKIMPKAIKQVLWRILIFYLATLTLLGFLVSARDPQLISGSSKSSTSPFVIAIEQGGVKGLPSVFNVVILVALLSIGNSAVYGFSRTLLALAQQGLAPKVFNYVDRKGRPLAAIAVSFIVGLLAFVSASEYESEIFEWLVSLSGLSTLFTWFSINFALIRLRAALKRQGKSTEDLPYRSKTGVWGAYYGAIMNFTVLALQFWLALYPVGKKTPSATVFFKTYLACIIVIAFYLVHKVWTKNWIILIKAEDIDLQKGKSDLDLDLMRQEMAEEKEIRRRQPLYKKVCSFWC